MPLNLSVQVQNTGEKFVPFASELRFTMQ